MHGCMYDVMAISCMCTVTLLWMAQLRGTQCRSCWLQCVTRAKPARPVAPQDTNRAVWLQCVSEDEPTDGIGRIGTHMHGMRCHGPVHRVARSRGGCKCTPVAVKEPHTTPSQH